jgi:diadenosine tetraphosphate (Ap4A) HIT family hydrolase
MYYHYRAKRKIYNKRRAADTGCSFCNTITPEQYLRETEHSIVVENRTPYDLWEHHQVEQHLMVIPKRHVHSLNDLSDAELLDAMKLCAEYEADGYNLYARSTGSTRRSVLHQHTHLIKIGPAAVKAGFYARKPYLHITF